MAGFYIVMTAFVMLIIIGIIYFVFQICAILGIVFSVAVLVQSDRFIKTEGRTNFRHAKGFGATKGLGTAATVFSVISCIVGAFTLLLIAAFSSEVLNDPEQSFDIVLLLAAVVIGCGTQIACIVLKIISSKRFREAKAYRESLYRTEGFFAEGAPPQTVYTTAYTEDINASGYETFSCPNCGTENNSINRFCVQCGETLKK